MLDDSDISLSHSVNFRKGKEVKYLSKELFVIISINKIFHVNEIRPIFVGLYIQQKDRYVVNITQRERIFLLQVVKAKDFVKTNNIKRIFYTGSVL